MRNPLLTLLCLIMSVVAVHADEVLYEDSFDTYGTNTLLFDKGDWSCPTNAFTVTTNEIEGTAAWQESTLIGYGFSLAVEESVRIQVDNVFDISSDTADMFAGIKDSGSGDSRGVFTSFNGWAGGSIRYHTEYDLWWDSSTTSANASSNDAGFYMGVDTITDPMRMTWTIFKTETPYEFNLAVEYENLVNGAAGRATEIGVVDTNLWNATALQLYFGKGRAGPVTYDNFYAEKFRIAHPLVFWEDDFSAAYNGAEIQWSSVWRGNGNNAGWEGTNLGYMVQRPTLAGQSGAGFRGAVYNGVPFAPSTGDTSVVKFDWTLFTYGRENRPFLDIMMTTEVSTNGGGDNYTVAQGVDSPLTHMGFRIEQSTWPGPLDGQATSNGAFRAIFAQSTTPSVTNFITPGFLGLAPEDGDNESDPIEVTYVVEKGTVSDEWTIYLTMSNTTSGATWASDIIDVVDASFSAETNFYFAAYGPSDFASPGTGNHFDNFVGNYRRNLVIPPVRTGIEQYIIDYGLSGATLADMDSDGVDDLTEYALGGNPTNALLIGKQPTIVYGADHNVRYYYYEIQDIQAKPGVLIAGTGIEYAVSRRYSLDDDIWLTFPNGWNNSSTNHNVATNETGSMFIIYEEIMKQFWGADLDKNFVRLHIMDY